MLQNEFIVNDEAMNVVKSKQVNLTDTSFYFEFKIAAFLLTFSWSSEFILS